MMTHVGKGGVSSSARLKMQYLEGIGVESVNK